jgi:hypothetical protein
MEMADRPRALIFVFLLSPTREMTQSRSWRGKGADRVLRYRKYMRDCARNYAAGLEVAQEAMLLAQ